MIYQVKVSTFPVLGVIDGILEGYGKERGVSRRLNPLFNQFQKQIHTHMHIILRGTAAASK